MTINSMTGFGKGVCEKNGLKVTIEIKSVNHRFLDLGIKTPKYFLFAEDIIRKEMKDNFNRGHFDIFLTYDDSRQDTKEVVFDYDVINAYVSASKKLSDEFFLKDDIKTSDIFNLQDVMKIVSKEDDEEFLSQIVKDAMKDAISNISKMRAKEGEAMKKDIVSKIETIKSIVASIELKAPEMTKLHFEKVRERIQEMLQDTMIDEARLLNEVALYSDKVCVDEEIQRLKSHINHFMEIVENGGIVGKQLDFIVQEMNREANTCGSKCNNIEVSNLVIALKNEIEKTREQVQNIE